MTISAKTATAPFTVGQRVWVYDVNAIARRGRESAPAEGAVTKVGRKLVTVRYSHGYEQVFRIDTGRVNDNYGHQWIKTDQQQADDERRGVLDAELRACGVEMRTGYRLPLDALEAVAAALRDTLGEPEAVR